MTQHVVTLDDKYDLAKDRIFIIGPQVVVRATLVQKALDRKAGPQHGRLCHRLSRLAASAASTRPSSAPQPCSSRKHIKFHAGPQRGPGGDRAVGHPAGRDAGRGRL